jgi:prepilin-type N-terminal cleavage/methylation domain-containing protein
MLKNKGFSLLELMLVIAVIAIIFSVATPLAIDFYQRQLVNEVQDNIINTLKQARHNAVLQKNDSNFGVNISTSTEKFILFQGDSYDTRIDTYDEEYDLMPDIAILGPTEVVFSKLTGLPSATGTISLVVGNIARGILIGDSGDVSKNN